MEISIMKKFIVFIIILTFTISASAQDKGWKFSVGFDPMITWIAAKDKLESDGSRFGFDFSLYAENYFNERYAFYTGLSFMNIGGRVKNVGDEPLHFKHFDLDKGVTTNIRAQYITIPIGIKLHTATFGLFSYYFNAGLYTGVRVGGSISNPNNNDRNSINGDINLINAGCQLSAGTMYALGGGTFLQGGIKFNYGFIDMLRTNALNGQPVGLGLHLGILF